MDIWRNIEFDVLGQEDEGCPEDVPILMSDQEIDDLEDEGYSAVLPNEDWDDDLNLERGFWVNVLPQEEEEKEEHGEGEQEEGVQGEGQQEEDEHQEVEHQEEPEGEDGENEEDL